MADDGDISRARICIDFGTALSKAAVCLDPTLPLEVGVKPLPIGAISGAEHPLLTPSVLYVDNGRLYFGPIAFEHARRGVEDQRDPLLSFKTVLGARNLQEALTTKIRPSVDPTGTFTHRDVLVLYLAYLDRLIAEALELAPNMPPGTALARRRYTSPVWRPGSGIEKEFEGIFNEASAISFKLGNLLLAREGVSIAQCKDALDKARANPADGMLETGIFEPHAAAAAALAFTCEPTNHVIVFDMGAGTTDIAAFEFDDRTMPPSLSEIQEARQCSALAGDEIDRIVIDLMLRKAGLRKGEEEEVKVARIARLAGRSLKQELIHTGKCSLKLGWRTLNLRAEDLQQDERFRAYIQALIRTIAGSLQAVIPRAEAMGSPVIDVVLAGGGAHLTFLPNVVKKAGEGFNTSVQLRIGALSPVNPIYEGIDPILAGVFPQIAMSVGGALVEMMPAR
jgi:molecular chaperone DnaK (HSP70)